MQKIAACQSFNWLTEIFPIRQDQDDVQRCILGNSCLLRRSVLSFGHMKSLGCNRANFSCQSSNVGRRGGTTSKQSRGSVAWWGNSFRRLCFSSESWTHAILTKGSLRCCVRKNGLDYWKETHAAVQHRYARRGLVRQVGLVSSCKRPI